MKLEEQSDEENDTGLNLLTPDISVESLTGIGSLQMALLECGNALAKDVKELTSLNPLLNCLRALKMSSIPDKYAKELLEPLINHHATRSHAVWFLCKQASIRRRAFSEGPTFLSKVTDLCTLKAEEWYTWDQGSLKHIVEMLGDFGSRLTSRRIEDCIRNVWQMARKHVNLVHLFLVSIQRLLSSTYLSPKTIGFLRSFVCCEMLRELSDVDSVELNEASALSYAASCVKEIPLSFLDEHGFFRLDPKGKSRDEVFRAIIILQLVGLSLFDGTNKSDWLATVTAFISKATLLAFPRSQVWPLQCHLALTTREAMSTKQKTELVSQVLELQLLTTRDNSRSSLEWLGILLGVWIQSSGIGSLYFEETRTPALPEEGMEQFVELQLQLLPSNIGKFSKTHKVSAFISNLLFRIRTRWLDEGVDNDSVNIIRESIVHCHCPGGNDDAFVRLIDVKR